MLKKGQLHVIFWHFLQNMEILQVLVLSPEIPHEFCKFHYIFKKYWGKVESSGNLTKILCYFLAPNSANSVLRPLDWGKSMVFLLHLQGWDLREKAHEPPGLIRQKIY